tara:strand:+ start:715 stop:1884 length:1170 start_codon:yes stop_codon:yes gene_type:complete
MVVVKHNSTGNILGSSSELTQLRGLIKQCAASDAPVLLRGESGTGKELVSRALHSQSVRASNPFVAINCGAIPDQLLESELFGHRRGAFTGATCDRKGRFELAHKGTLFLDEIGDMPSQLQVKFLRVLEEKVIQPLGGTSEIEVDVRIVAATHRDLEEMVSEGEFREDLLYRLNVLPIRIPPLSQRKEDIPELLDHFAESFAVSNKRVSFTRRSLLLLQAYSWPGNVRELSNLVQRFSVLYPGKTIELSKIPEEFLSQELIHMAGFSEDSTIGEQSDVNSGEKEDLRSFHEVEEETGLNDSLPQANNEEGVDFLANDFEQIIELSNTITTLPDAGVPTKDILNNLESNLIRTALDQTNGNVSKASELLQMGRTSLIQKINKYHLDKNQA